MSRPLFVRPFRKGEIKKLRSWAKSSSNYDRRLRAQIVLKSAEGKKSPQICAELGVCDPTVKRWIKRFNREGPQGLLSHIGGGRPPLWNEQHLKNLQTVVDTSPLEAGEVRTLWSLRSLTAYLRRKGLIPTKSHETVRTWLKKIGLLYRPGRKFCGPKGPDFLPQGT